MINQALVDKFIQDVVRCFLPERIIMFGSQTYGNSTSDSDVDLLVIMPFEGKACRKAVEVLNHINPRFPIELLVRTPEQIKSRLAIGDFFIKEIMEKGKVLYETSLPRVGREGGE